MAKNSFLSSTPARVLSVLLVFQAVLFYSFASGEYVPVSRPLKQFPVTLSGWTMVQEGVMEPEIADLLKADDTLNRTYVDASQTRIANLFIAFFKTQRAGVTPHSPKVCLPGSGWYPLDSTIFPASIPGLPSPIRINRYTVAKGEERSVVLYWYQTPYRVIASEYMAKVYLMVDGLRHRRSDTSMVRVVVPVIDGNEEQAEKVALEFVRTIFRPVRDYLPA
jgi:EpsI family protein